MVGFDFRRWKKDKIKQGKWLSKKDYKKGKKKKTDFNLFKKLVRDTQRKVIFDTETTGLGNNDRIIEICLWEIINDNKTDNYLHFYFNPEMIVPEEAVKIHGITDDFLKDKPLFKDKYQEIIDFISDSNLIAHNASFDRRMLNNEFRRIGKNILPKHDFIDTLKAARYLYPKEKNNQDALCQRFNLLDDKRGNHSAKQDVELLYEIYINLKCLLREKKITDFFLY